MTLDSQIESLIQCTRKASLPLAQMEDFYRKQFGYPLRPDDYGESNVIQVLKKLPQLLRVESGPPKPSTPPAATGGSSEETSTSEKAEQPTASSEVWVRLIDRTYVRTLGLQVKEILAEQPEGKMELKEFEKAYKDKFNASIKPDQVFTDLSGLIEVEKSSEAAAAKAGTKKDSGNVNGKKASVSDTNNNSPVVESREGEGDGSNK